MAVYGYAHMPQKFKAQRQIDERELPDAAERLALLQVAIERLTAAGYCYIGLDHFALPGDDLSVALAAGSLQRNFMGYTTHAESDLIGLGASSISHVGDSYSQNFRDLAAVGSRPWTRADLPIARGLVLDDDDVIRARRSSSSSCAAASSTARRSKPASRSISTRTSPSRWRGCCRWRADGLVDVRRLAHRRHLARPADAAYHRHVLRPLSCDTVRFRNAATPFARALIAPAAPGRARLTWRRPRAGSQPDCR